MKWTGLSVHESHLWELDLSATVSCSFWQVRLWKVIKLFKVWHIPLLLLCYTMYISNSHLNSLNSIATPDDSSLERPTRDVAWTLEPRPVPLFDQEKWRFKTNKQIKQKQTKILFVHSEYSLWEGFSFGSSLSRFRTHICTFHQSIVVFMVNSQTHFLLQKAPPRFSSLFTRVQTDKLHIVKEIIFPVR